jgi:hypothetical protein
MRNTNCQNIRREIEEAGSADLLGVAAISHIQGCPACETLSQQQTRLQELVSSLGTVEAPGDFDFRLRARLAGEKRGGASSFLSFGLRPAAIAAVLLLIGSAIVFLSFRTQPAPPVASRQETPKAGATDAKPVQNAIPPSSTVATTSVKNESSGSGGVRPIERAPKNRGFRNELTASQGKRPGTLDSGSTPAPSLKRDDSLAASYPTAAFPINASYQSLKVSVDDGRGASRTISLPTVSFGSERSISQNPSPLMASARGSW